MQKLMAETGKLILQVLQQRPWIFIAPPVLALCEDLSLTLEKI